MKLEDFIGKQIAIQSPFLHETTLQKVTLHGVEAGGIWIESQALLNHILQTLRVPGSPRTVVFFLPYHQVTYIMESISQSALNEVAFGV